LLSGADAAVCTVLEFVVLPFGCWL